MSIVDNVLLRVLPRQPWADRIIHRRGFIRSLGRAPSVEHGGMNDAIFYIMTGPEALNQERIGVTDKEYVKSYVRAKIGDRYNVPTVGVFRNLEDVRGFCTNNDVTHCVIKPTHLSARVMFTPPHGEINYTEIEDWFATNYYWWNREPFYRTLERKAIIERVLFGTTNIEDYKIMCVRGEPRMIWVDTDRRIGHKRTFYTCDWKRLPVALGCPQGADVPKPANLEEMLHVASRLSEDFSMIRVDLYSNGAQCYVGELTNSSGCGRERFLEGEQVVTDLLFGAKGIRPVLEEVSGKGLARGRLPAAQ